MGVNGSDEYWMPEHVRGYLRGWGLSFPWMTWSLGFGHFYQRLPVARNAWDNGDAWGDWRMGVRGMGQHYIWANPDKREYIEDEPFEGTGFVLSCLVGVGQPMTDAACTMIAGPWRGDTVIYVGDYWTDDNYDDERSRRLFAKFDGYPYEDILNRFENVTGHFVEARGHEYPDYLHSEERGDIYDEPYTGPFDLRVRSWRYAVNRTRREFVNRRQGSVRDIFQWNGGFDFDRCDPTVLLYAMGPIDDEWGGRWCSDLVDMCDDAPGEDYRDVTTEAASSWIWGPTIMADDLEVRRALASARFRRELEDRGWIERHEDGWPIGGALAALASVLAEGPL